MNRGAVAGVREGKRRGTVNGPPSSCRGDCIVPAQANVLIELRLASGCNINAGQCRCWVMSGHWHLSGSCPLYPQKRTSDLVRLTPSPGDPPRLIF